jgi:hypothetical protein
MQKPVLQAMVLADHVYRDAASGKYIIAGTFGVIWQGEQKLAPTPADSQVAGERQTFTGTIGRAGSPYLYLALSDVHGRVPLKLRYINLADSSVLIEGQIEVVSSDPLSMVEAAIGLPLLPIVPGIFSLDLLFEGEILGSWRVTVKRQPADNTTKSE